MERGILPSKSKGVSFSWSYVIQATCVRCGKKHDGRCLASMEGFYDCGGIDHNIRDCPVITTRVREGKKIRLDSLQD